MRALILLRHSLTEANERRLYYGWTDLPLSPGGRALCAELRQVRPLPAFEDAVTSGLIRTDETLRLLTGRGPDAVLPDLREMHFGRFEMHSYEELKDDPEYQRWVGDDAGAGAVPCPGGESRAQFRERVLRGGEALLSRPGEHVLAVLHGGVVVRLMEAWFPGEGRDYYGWLPGPCRGYRVDVKDGRPVAFAPI